MYRSTASEVRGCFDDFDDNVGKATYVPTPSVLNVLGCYICVFLMAREQNHNLWFVFCEWGFKDTGGSANGAEERHPRC